MLNLSLGLFLMAHGLVHLWYMSLSQRLVPFETAMGWTGKSWLFTNLVGDPMTRTLAGALYLLATIEFLIAGVAITLQADWARVLVMAAAATSALTVMLFWDGSYQQLVEKGLVGLFIDAAILVAVLMIVK